MMKAILLFIYCLLLFSEGYSQSKKFTLPLAASARGDAKTEDFFPALQENEIDDEFGNSGDLNLLKQQLLQRIHKSSAQTNQQKLRNVIDTAYAWKTFQGNAGTQGVPNDNDIAVSNTGYLISAVNTNLFRYDLNNDSLLGTISLQTFSSSLNNFSAKCDAHVIYDPDVNKFIVVFIAGYSSHITSKLIVAFSTSDNPDGLWNFYELPGNPLDDSTWTDYPLVALTNHELFITVNLLHDGGSWQTAWKQTVIWQVNKFDGFNGDSLHTQLHWDINYGGRGVRNLCPVRGGSHLYGSDIYFMSERNLDAENDTFFLVHITDTINSPLQQFTVQSLVSSTPYFVPVNAKQPSVLDLATNDSRVLGAFYENDRIQLVGNTTDTSFGTSAFYHGVITNVSSSPQISLNIISDDTLCYGYPNISYAGNSSADNSAIIDVLKSAVNVNPGHASFVTDGDGNYSVMKDVKDGLSYHYAINGTQRWGDYTGSQRDYTSQGNVWIAGSFATATHAVSTWLTLLGLQHPPASVPTIASTPQLVNIYPNPTASEVMIKFDVPADFLCSFDLYDAQGKFIAKLMEENVKPGENIFSFSVAPLAAGEYFLRISSEGKELATKKIVKQ
ncbi:MAG: T9SS type A sorting domain-containing protein [Chitinophagales bacterium]